MDIWKNRDLKDIVYWCDFDLVFKTEQWKDIPGYIGRYKASDIGRIKSVKRDYYLHVNKNIATRKEIILKLSMDYKGYIRVNMRKDLKHKQYQVHKIVAMSFLNHESCGMKFVINHKNFIRYDNMIRNLEIVTNRENTNKKHLPSSSKYTGVGWSKKAKKWTSYIRVEGVQKHLGTFSNEYDAHLAYEKALNKV